MQLYSPGPWFNIKITSYQYRKSHCGDKMILQPSNLHNGISYTGKMTSLYWIRALVCFILLCHRSMGGTISWKMVCSHIIWLGDMVIEKLPAQSASHRAPQWRSSNKHAYIYIYIYILTLFTVVLDERHVHLLAVFFRFLNGSKSWFRFFPTMEAHGSLRMLLDTLLDKETRGIYTRRNLVPWSSE